MRTTQTATNKELSAGLTEITEDERHGNPPPRVQTTGSPNHGFRNTRLSTVLPHGQQTFVATKNDDSASFVGMQEVIVSGPLAGKLR